MNEKDYKLTTLDPMIDENHQDCVWYGGDLVLVEYKGWKFILGAYGDVRATLYDESGEEIAEVRDKNNYGLFYDEMDRYIAGDKEMYALESEDKLVFGNNNWFEVFAVDPAGEEREGYLTASASYKDAVKEMIDSMDEYIADNTPAHVIINK